ncbi:FGGY family carbohydrate kinase [Micromonospora cathayae]|uniref:FGGY family carbohydrate kinase n=1 Tax=Micromonospora cathayae TaxID=3028804 RepID=A0ABY7ZPS7_9ACTN|nr:FGGY family carbohydrate kinase [Micromonospora sp. HUAS 3]WDZ84068.1 FGGY family carbohydrate kinase [Micromonospora sp. HUAS 3]
MKILALDLGTSSVRGLVLDERTVPLPGALARRKMRLAVGDDGAGTLDGPGYLACLVECLDELAAAGHLRDVTLVAISAQWHSVLPVDAAGTPLGPVLTWLDTRPEPSDDHPGPADPDAFHQRTGTWWHRCYWSARLPWLRARVPAARFVGLAEYVLGALLGTVPMSVSQASGTGLLDLRTLDWDAEACELAGVRAGELPALAPPDWRGRLLPEFARRWPGLAGAAWTAPIGDGAASNVGSGCVDARRAAVTVGTSSAVRLLQPAPAGAPLPPLPQRLWRYRVDHDHVVTGAAYSSGGNLFAWANRELRLPSGAELDAALAEVPPDGGVPADPRFGGDRPPGRAPAGSGRLDGLSLSTSAVEILAGLMAGVCARVADDLAVIESTVAHPVEVVLGGGAVTASAWWRGAFAAALAPRSVRHQPNPEIGATGAALVALGRTAGAGA